MTLQPLGQRLKQWRTPRGMSLHDIAAKIDVSASTLSRIENGSQTFSHETAIAIERLISPDGPPPPTDWRTTASALDAENAKLAADNQALRKLLGDAYRVSAHYEVLAYEHWQAIQSLQRQLADERRVSDWFEAAALALQDEVSTLQYALSGDYEVWYCVDCGAETDGLGCGACHNGTGLWCVSKEQ